MNTRPEEPTVLTPRLQSTSSMPRSLHLDQLPKELLAQIATHLNTLSVLALSRTSHTLRAATHDPLIYRTLLLNSHALLSPESAQLNIPALTSRCTANPDQWARYALAHNLASNSTPSLTNDPVAYLPALTLIGYPPSCLWFTPEALRLSSILDERPAILFTLTLNILSFGAAQAPPPPQHADAYFQHLDPSESQTYLHALAKCASDLKAGMRTRQRVWPYNDDARVPFIEPPVPGRIPLAPLNDTYDLPLPFAPPEVWNRWYRSHCVAMRGDEDFMFGSNWVGYYTYDRQQGQSLDPPMMKIHFHVSKRGTEMASARDAAPRDVEKDTWVTADECYDGVGPFSVRGLIRVQEEGEVVFRGEKMYKRAAVGWSWDLRLTPTGWVGYWGNESLRNSPPHRMGFVWLWKDEWTAAEGR